MGFGYITKLCPTAIRIAFQQLENVEWTLQMTTKLVGGEITGTDVVKSAVGRTVQGRIQKSKTMSIDSPPLPRVEFGNVLKKKKNFNSKN
jgi:hypothetical protein